MTASTPSAASPIPVADSRNGLGTAALVCALTGLAFDFSPTMTALGFLLGLAALVVGAIGARRVRRGDATNTATVTAALLVGAVALVGALASGPSTAAPESSASTSSVGAEAPVAPLTPAAPIGARDWQLIAKDPAGHAGQRVIIYGRVTQFDSVTGIASFRADVDGTQHAAQYGMADYPTNTVLDGDATDLSGLVQDDLFQAEATVTGSYTYENTMGGSMTVPHFTVTKLTVTGDH